MSPTSTLTLSTLAVVLLARGAIASYGGVYQACASGYMDVPTPYNYVDGLTTNEACQNACSEDEYVYDLWYGPKTQCFCTNTPVEPSNYVAATDSAGTCGSTSYIVSVTVSSFSFSGCYSSGFGTYTESAYVDSLEDCFQQCQSVSQALVQPSVASDTMICYCADDTQTFAENSASTCGTNQFFAYVHQAGASVPDTDDYDSTNYASGLVRRQLRERLALGGAGRGEQQMGRYAHCPQPKMACVVPGSTMSFECIDPLEELESCGGCLYGEFNNATSTVPGVDCTSLPGVASGAVTCSSGQCKAFKCKQGYKLSADATCVKV